MNDYRDISDLLPLLASGKLDAEQEALVRKRVAESTALQQELEFLQGLSSVRAQMARYDRSAHPGPEALDRLARGEITEMSAEYSQLSAHLENCTDCQTDVDLLRQVQEHLPDQLTAPDRVAIEPWWQRAFSLLLRPGWATATVASMAFLLLVSFTAFSPHGRQNLIQTIMLQPQFESRNLTADQHIKEQAFFLPGQQSRIRFEFETDRLEFDDYRYQIALTPQHGEMVFLSDEEVRCTQRERINLCEVTVKDPQIMNLLHQGGSFTITILEELPAGSEIEPAHYEYHIKVLTQP